MTLDRKVVGTLALLNMVIRMRPIEGYIMILCRISLLRKVGILSQITYDNSKRRIK